MKQSGGWTWIFIIAIGVCVGNLSSNFIIAAYVAIQAEKVMQEASKQLTLERERVVKRNAQLKQQLSEQQMAQEEAARLQRENDAIGKGLSRQCEEWVIQYQRTPTPFVLQNQTVACNKFSSYKNTGAYQN